ncbi:ribonuclease H-like domain-containing protein [Tanacetum coccineum]
MHVLLLQTFEGAMEAICPQVAEGPQTTEMVEKGWDTQGLKESRKLKHGELNLVMGNMKITLGRTRHELEYYFVNLLNGSGVCFMVSGFGGQKVMVHEVLKWFRACRSREQVWHELLLSKNEMTRLSMLGLVFSCFSLFLAEHRSVGDKRKALIEFKHGLIDEAHRLTSWVIGEESDYFRWAVIVCDNITRHIHQIHLLGLNGHCEDYYNTDKEREESSKQRLRGNLSSSLLHLKQLRHLDLSCNNFTMSRVPNFLGSLGNLSISGIIQDSLGRLSILRTLDLRKNLVSGYIPFSIGQSTSLEVLNLSDNQLNGSLLESIGRLRGDGNSLCQTRELEIFTKYKLDSPFLVIGFKFKHLASSFWRPFPKLRFLDMSQNNIQGMLSNVLATLISLDLSYNNFSGRLPHLSKDLILYFLDLSNNAFEVSLHHLSCPYERNSVAVLDLGNNHLSGVIPECWETLQALSFLKAGQYGKETHRASIKFMRESHPIPPNSRATSSTKGRFDVFFHNQLLVFQQHQDESLYDSWTRFKDIIRKVSNRGLSIWTLIEIFLKHLDSLSRHIINLIAEGDLRKFSDIGAWEVPSFDGPEPQPLLNSPSLDVSLGDVIGPKPPIKPHSLDSSKMKVVDYLTTQTPPSPHVANSYPKGIDISNWEIFDDDWGLESNEVSPLGEELGLFDRPNEVERGRLLEAHCLESILQ